MTLCMFDNVRSSYQKWSITETWPFMHNKYIKKCHERNYLTYSAAYSETGETKNTGKKRGRGNDYHIVMLIE